MEEIRVDEFLEEENATQEIIVEKKKIKISFKKILCIMLVVVMTFSCATSVYAARAKKYISELKISYDHEGPNAKQALISQGYSVVSQDLNEDADDILSKSRVVYIGYKTTQKPEEAITDVAMMSEENGYSFSDYQDMLKEKLSAFNDLAVKEMDMIREFRVNYKAGNPLAITAYNSLNNFMEDDSGKLVGDFLLDEGLTHDALFKFITQTTQAMQGAFNILLAGAVAETTDDNFMTRLTAMSAEESAKVKEDASLNDNAMLLYEQTKTLKEDVLTATTFVDSANAMTDEEIKAKEGDTEWQMDLLENTKTLDIAETLKTVMVGEKSFYDIVMQDELLVTELYPLVSVLTKGQLTAITFVGYTNYISSMANLNKEDGATLVTEQEKEKPEVVSAYFGVDRSMFTDDVAITSNALREINATADKSAIYGRSDTSMAINLAIAAGTTFGIASVTSIYLAGLGKYTTKFLGTSRPLSFFGLTNVARTDIGWALLEVRPRIQGGITKATTKVISKNPVLRAGLQIAKIGTMLMVLSLVVAIACTFLLVDEIFNIYNPEYTKIPKIMLDMLDAKDNTKYVRYNVVNGQDDKPGDVNGFAGKRWNALYWTKDQSAGKPIEANVQVTSNSSSLKGKEYLGVHEFGAESAVNLNNFTFSSSAKPTYLFFTKDLNYVAPSAKTGSVFTDMMPPIIAGFAGILVGIAGTTIVIRARKVKDPATSQNPIG